jgi:hypothetical protein
MIDFLSIFCHKNVSSCHKTSSIHIQKVCLVANCTLGLASCVDDIGDLSIYAMLTVFVENFRLSLRGHNVTIYSEMQAEATMPTKLENGVTGRWVILPAATVGDPKTVMQMHTRKWTTDFGPLVMAWPFNMGSKALNKILADQPDAWWSVANQTWDFMFADELFR